MRTSILGSVILLAGASATTAIATTTGNNLALSGSDTLYDVTRDVISACGAQFPGAAGFATKGITYEGGGSDVGVVEMQLGAQEIAPMSRAMRTDEFCPPYPSYNAADLLIGLDGMSIVTSKTSSCSTATVNQVGNPSFTYAGGTYTLGAVAGVPASIDALRILYMGLDQNGAADCGSNLRRTLIQSWRNLFTTDPSCAGGDTHCSSGLTHAWRLADVSGTSEALADILTAHNGAGLHIGTMSVVNNPTQWINPFCNSFERNDPNHQPQYLDGTALLSDGVTTTPMSDGRVNDMSDHDPIRTPCDDNDSVCGSAGQCLSQTTQAACLATSAQCEWSGVGCSTTQDLGVVLPVFVPDVPYLNSELYPTTACSGSCAQIPVITGGAMPTGYKCQNGTNPIAGRCWVPVISTASMDPRCVVTDPSMRCFGTPGANAVDGRVWNKNTMVLSSELPAPYRFAGATYQVALDRNHRLMDGSFYRMHMRAASTYNTRAPDANYTGTCQENDASSQIGCLVDADDCSMGYSSRTAARTFPGGALDSNKALMVDGASPFTSNALTNLLASSGTMPLYELSRRLYLAAGPGGSLAGLAAGSGEQMLAQCISKDSLVGPAMTAHGYVPIPASAGGVQCLDYDETKPLGFIPQAPLVNTQGAGNVALPGCGLSTNPSGCINVDNVHGYLFGQ